MPEMNQENNLNVENNATPVVPVEPVTPNVEVAVAPVVDVAPTVEIPTVEIKEEPVVTEAPVVQIAPTEIVPESVPAPVMVNEIPEVLPVNNDVPAEESVVTVTPETVVEAAPVIETAPVVEAALDVVNEVAPVVEATPEVVSEVAPVAEMPMPEVTTEVVDDIPVIETTPAIEENSNNVVITNETPAAPEAPVVQGEENTIINSVVSDVTPSVTPETNATEPVAGTPVEPVKKEGKKVWLFVVLGVVALVVGVVLALYFFVYSKPTFLFEKSLSVLRNNLNAEEVSSAKPMQLDLSFQSNINTTDESLKPIFDNINKLYLETSIYLDLGNKIEFMKLKSKYKDQDFVNADIFVEKENAFVKLDKLFDKYIKVVLEEDIFKENEGNKDAIIVVDGLLAAIENSLDDKYFTKVEKTVSLNNVVKKVNANTLVINNENVIPFLTSIINELKANNQFLEAFARMQEIEKADVVTVLDKTLSDMKETSGMVGEVNYQISFYTEGFMNKPVGMGVVADGSAYDVYFTEETLSVLTTVESSTEVLLDASKKDDKYNVNIYLGEDTLSFVLGFKVNENPSFTKPDVTNFVEAEKLTQDEVGQITGALIQSPGVMTFMTDFQDVIAMLQMMMGSGMDQVEGDFTTDFDSDMMGDNTLYLE